MGDHERSLLGLERLALWPEMALEMSSCPWRSSCISSEMTDLFPAEAIFADLCVF